MCEICDQKSYGEVADGFLPLLKFLRNQFKRPHAAVLTALAVARYITEEQQRVYGGAATFEQMLESAQTVEVTMIRKEDLIQAVAAATKKDLQ